MHILIVGALVLLAFIVLLSKRKSPPKIETNGSKFEREIDEGTFQELVVETSFTTPVLIDFYADWCAPCHYLTPLLADLAKEYDGAFLLAKVNSDENVALKNEYAIEALPTVLLVKDGKILERFSGGKLEHTIRYTLARYDIKAPLSDI